MKQPLFALIDCNNFFVSCEQVFRPDLVGKPVVVLSSNDGCAIARSPEAKALGIPMAAPAFKYRQAFRDNNVVQFSANFELYGDISRRITEVLTSITPRLEVYSIDESFLDISELDIPDCEKWAREVRRTIKDWIGVPVSIGVARTKTLAKVASQCAKKEPKHKGVLVLDEKEHIATHLRKVPVEDVWGVGRRMAPQLRSLGLATAQNLASLTPAQGRKIFHSISGERLVRELNGQGCIPLEQLGSAQKSISATRTFGHDTAEIHALESAMASFVARAALRLRAQRQMTQSLRIFLTTNRHRPGYRKWSKEIKLAQPTSDTGVLIGYANQLLREVFVKGADYHRAGVILDRLVDDSSLQMDLVGIRSANTFDRSKSRMKAIDSLRSKYGKPVVHYAAEGLSRSWEPKRITRSPAYTTSWDELPRVKIKV